MAGARLCTVAKRSIGAPVPAAHMQVKLIDRLQLGDLEEQRAAVGQHVSRPDRKRVMTDLSRDGESTARASRSWVHSDSSTPARSSDPRARRHPYPAEVRT